MNEKISVSGLVHTQRNPLHLKSSSMLCVLLSKCTRSCTEPQAEGRTSIQVLTSPIHM